MSINVLLADDHTILRDGLAAILSQRENFTVVGQAGNGREAVRLCREKHPDIVVMDINMPELNGVEATRQIQLDWPEIQVIILSMYATKEHIYQAFQAGARGYLLKETSGLEVVDAILAVAEGRRYLSKTLTDQVIEDYVLQREASSTGPLDSLSDREKQVLQLVVEGHSNREIADLLHLAVSTVSTYRSRLMKKLGVDDLAGLVKFAIQHGIIDAG